MQKGKILIVDFEADVHTLLSLNLEHHGYDCLSAFDLDAAKDIIKNGHPTLVILGYSIPAHESSAFLKELHQASQITHEAPTVLVLGAQMNRKTEEKIENKVTFKPYASAHIVQDVNRCFLASA